MDIRLYVQGRTITEINVPETTTVAQLKEMESLNDDVTISVGGEVMNDEDVIPEGSTVIGAGQTKGGM